MNSLGLSSARARRALRRLATCGIAVTALACTSDDMDTDTDTDSKQTTENAASAANAGTEKTPSDSKLSTQDAGKSSDSGMPSSTKPRSDTKTASAGSAATSSAQTSQTPTQTAGEEAVMRYDGTWQGKTSQGKPVSFKILNRFLAHIDLAYTGAGKDADAGSCSDETNEAKVSAMLSLRGTSFTLMKETEQLTLKVMANFPSDTSAEGTFEVTQKGDCHAKISGTWTAKKSK